MNWTPTSPTRTAWLLVALALLTACDNDNGLIPQPASPDLALVQVASGLAQPVHITHAGDDSDRLFIVERAGRVRVLAAGALQSTPFLDISARVRSAAGEQGLLSIAFAPDFTDSGEFYVHYTAASDGRSVVSRFRSDGAGADPASEEVLLEVAQPAANHNGGQLAFSPHDGYLYIGLGDGGGSGDEFAQAQDTATLLGTILRIDVRPEAGSPYGIPADNPFPGSAAPPDARAEIWAFGLRNPWRFSFDRLTGDLWIGDVGQGRYEEINFQPVASTGGENYGWSLMEASHCFPALVTDCLRDDLTLPVAEYAHVGGGCSGSVTGGHVYRGAAHPALHGYYLFGDFCTGQLRGLRLSASGPDQTFTFDTGLAISTFGEDEAGELYLADFVTGDIYRVTSP